MSSGKPETAQPPRPPHKGAAVTNVELKLSSGGFGQHMLGCQFDGHRYHVWLDPQTLEPAEPTLFKNPLAGIGPHDEGYFYCRRLDLSKPLGQWLLVAMRAEVDAQGLLEKAHEARAEEERQRQKEQLARILRQSKEEAAEELFECLKCYVEQFAGQGEALERKARKLLQRIERSGVHSVKSAPSE